MIGKKIQIIVRNLMIIITLLSIIFLSTLYTPRSGTSLSFYLNDDVQPPSLPSSPHYQSPIRQTRADSFDIELTGEQEIENITLSSFSRMIIRDANVTVNGVITISEYGTLFIINSTVVVNPPDIDEDTSVISLTDLASIRIYESNITVNSCPNPTSVPFIITDDESSFTIMDSEFTAVLPSITEMITKIEGSIVPVGKSIWTISNSRINAVAGFTGGWFCFGLVGGTMNVFGSTFYTESHFVDLFAHSFGTMRIVDSNIIGRTMFEGTSVGEIINSSLLPEPNGFTSLGVIDSTQCTIINSTFNGLVGLNDKSVVEVYNSTFDENRGIRMAKNASLTLVDCSIPPHCDLLQNATLSVYRSSDIEIHILDLSFIGVYSNCTVGIRDSSVAYLNVNEYDNVFISIKNSTIEKLSTYDYAGIFGDMDGSSVENLSLGADNVLNLTLQKTSIIKNLFSNINCTFNITLIDDSKIQDIIRNKDTWHITTIDSPLLEILIENVSISIMHRLFVKTTLNTNVISSFIEVSNDNGLVASGQSQGGAITFILLYQEIDDSGTHTIDEYIVSSSYFGLGVTESITLDVSKELEISFEDYSPPVISDFKYEKNLWNIENQVTSSMCVEARVMDEDIHEVTNVTIRYSTDDGKTWREISMTNLGNDVYEGIIPEQEAGSTVRFSVVADDVAQNSASTSIIAYQEAIGTSTIILWIIIVVVVLIIIAVVIKLRKARKIRRYTDQKISCENEMGPKDKIGSSEG